MLKYMRMGNKRIKAIWWILTVITVVTFVFLFGTAFDPRFTHKATGAVAVVDGRPVTRQEYQNFLNDTRAQYRRQYGGDPSEEDERMVEAQAWRGIVTQVLLDQKARKLGLGAHDAEVVTLLKASPPTQLALAPDFQTNGKFDPSKYQAALANPNANWSPFEQMVRDQLPSRKLQEHLAASLKLSQPELQDLFRGTTETAALTAVIVPPQTVGNVPAITDADISRVYDEYKNRLATGERAQLEILQSPRQYSPEDLRVAREQAQALADRARKGEDFAALARDYSQGAGANQGGAINRAFQPSEFGPLAAQVASAPKGTVLDPVEQMGRFIIFKIVDHVQDPVSPTPSLRVAQIVIKAQMSDDAVRAQIDKLDKVRDRAARVGLSKAASEAGLATSKSGYFELSNPPQQLFDAPEALDFAISHKKGDVSPVFMGADNFVVVEVDDRRAAGPATQDEIRDQLRQLAELEKRVDMAKPVADHIAQGLAQGMTLEAAA
ncbi:MAG: SurA N-terminal domain-containing protein, partial [Candidatus Eisenbacteria bacterium]